MNQELEKLYFEDLDRIKRSIFENRAKAMFVANSAMISSYYQIGMIINLRKSWGNKYIERLSKDLQQYGNGYSVEHLKKMSLFATVFSENEIREQPVTQIPWGSLIIIMNKSSSKEEMIWYINQTFKNRWSRSMVVKQFELQAYQRNLITPIVTDENLTSEIVKDTLVFNFISRKDVNSEKDLKTRLLDNIILFLQELGPGFALVGKEYRLITPANKSFYIDLLMYHTKVHAYVVIEVKLDEIIPADIGQLNFYINAINKIEKTEFDNDTIGILLCKNADKFVIQTSLANIDNPIGISKYKLLEDLPNYLAKRFKEINEF